MNKHERTTLSSPSAAYRPNLRDIPCELLTSYGWIGATMPVPHAHGLVDFLSNSPSFLKLTQVRLPDRLNPAAFFALQRSATVLVIPGVDKGISTEHMVAPSTTPVMFLLPGGVLDGHLAFSAHLRLSDFLRTHTGFIAVRDADWTPHSTVDVPTDASNPPRRGLRYVLVNASLVVGVEEIDERSQAI